MTWLNPAAFALLGFVPVLLLLHALRYRYREVEVSTLFLWESVAREAQGTLGLRRLVQNLPLFLQILLVLLMTAALAHPALTTTVPESKDVVLVLDISASMLTRTPGGTRFAEAQARALEELRALPKGRQMALIAAGHQPRVLSFFTEEKALLQQAISAMRPTEAPGNMRDAVLLALSFTQGSPTREVVVIGDGAYRQLTDLDMPRHQLRHIQVTGGEVNVGITRLAFRKAPGAEDHYEALIAVKNFARQPLEVPLQLTVHRRQLLARTLQLPPGHQEVVVATIDGEVKGVVQADILVDDDLALDNRAYGVLSRERQRWVLLVGESNFFLEKLLTSFPGTLVNLVPEVTAEALPRLLEANHLLIFNGVQPPPLRQGNFLLINTRAQDARLAWRGTVGRPRVLAWDRQHPLLRFVDLADVHITEALALHPQAGARSLVDGEGTALLSLIEEPHLRIVTLAFDLMQSDLPLRVAFPVLMHNLLHWLNPQADELAGGQIQAGRPYAVFFDPPVEHVTVQDPEGSRRLYEVHGNPWIFADAEHVGVYIMRAGEQKHYLTVSLLDETESDIAPDDRLPPLRPGASGVQQAGIIETPLWPFLLLGVAAALLGEWYIWCRDL